MASQTKRHEYRRVDNSNAEEVRRAFRECYELMKKDPILKCLSQSPVSQGYIPARVEELLLNTVSSLRQDEDKENTHTNKSVDVQARLSALQFRAEKAESELLSLRTVHGCCKRTIEKLEDENCHLRASKERDCLGEVVIDEERSGELEEIIRSLRARVQGSELALYNSKESERRLQEEVQCCRMEVEKLQEQKNALEKRLERNAKSTIRDGSLDATKRKEDVESQLKEMNRELCARLDQLKFDHQTLIELNNRLKSEIENLTSELSLAKKSKHESDLRIINQNTHLSDITSKQQELESVLSTLKSELSSSTHSNTQLAQALSSEKKRSSQLASTLEELTHSTSRTIDSLSSELTSLKQLNSTQLRDHENTVKRLEESWYGEREKNEKEVREKIMLKERVKEVERRLCQETIEKESLIEKVSFYRNHSEATAKRETSMPSKYIYKKPTSKAIAIEAFKAKTRAMKEEIETIKLMVQSEISSIKTIILRRITTLVTKSSSPPHPLPQPLQFKPSSSLHSQSTRPQSHSSSQQDYSQTDGREGQRSDLGIVNRERTGHLGSEDGWKGANGYGARNKRCQDGVDLQRIADLPPTLEYLERELMKKLNGQWKHRVEKFGW